MRCHRILTLLLLLCGLSTTPFFSLEQSPEDGLTASSVPQCSSRLKGNTFEAADPDAGTDLCGFDGHDSPVPIGQDDGWSRFDLVAISSTAPIPYPYSGAERLTYHPNAPPIRPVSKS